MFIYVSYIFSSNKCTPWITETCIAEKMCNYKAAYICNPQQATINRFPSVLDRLVVFFFFSKQPVHRVVCACQLQYFDKLAVACSAMVAFHASNSDVRERVECRSWTRGEHPSKKNWQHHRYFPLDVTNNIEIDLIITRVVFQYGYFVLFWLYKVCSIGNSVAFIVCVCVCVRKYFNSVRTKIMLP